MKISKKICLLFSVIIMFMFVGVVNVKAIELSLSPNNVNVGKTFKLSINDVKSGNTYSLDFDTSYIDVDNSTCGNRSNITANCELTLRAKSSLSLTESKPVSFTISEVAQNDETKTKTITINANKTTTTTKATTTTKTPTTATTTTTTTQAPKSNNANLKTLEIIGSDDSNVILSPDFSSSVYEYSATVDASVKNITINATMEDPKSNMVISNNATEELKAGENNKITITVMAEDGTKKAYVINIKREALTTDATLSSLTIKECKDFKLKEDKFSYDVKIGSSVTELSIDYVTSVEDATVSISGNENLKDGSKVKILVTAEDGTKKEYVLNIVKTIKKTKKSTPEIEAEKNPLIIMALSMVAFGLIGGIIYVIKK